MKSAKGGVKGGSKKTDSEKGSRGDGATATLDTEGGLGDESGEGSSFVAPEDHNLENIIKQVMFRKTDLAFAIFLHSNVLYNNILFVTGGGGRKKLWWGGGRKKHWGGWVWGGGGKTE